MGRLSDLVRTWQSGFYVLGVLLLSLMIGALVAGLILVATSLLFLLAGVEESFGFASIEELMLMLAPVWAPLAIGVALKHASLDRLAQAPYEDSGAPLPGK